MPYNITSAKFYKLEAGGKYFLDANIWINVLSPPNNPSYKTQQYYKVFDKILNDDTTKIIVPTLLVSEVINRILKMVYFPEFLRKNGTNKKDINQEYYKDIFRPSDYFIESYEVLTNDFIAYNDSIEFVNDGLGGEITYKDILENPPTNLDFNDNYYYNLALKRGYIVVTDDNDFWVQDVKIVTQNDTLLAKQTAENIRIYKEKNRK